MSLTPPTSPCPTAPPTTPGPIAAGQARSAWPTPIGVTSIVLGVVGALSHTVQIVSPLFMGAIQAGMPPEIQGQMDAQYAVTRRWLPVTLSVAAAQGVLALLLLSCGVMILTRKRAGPSLAIWWAGVKVIVVAVSVYVAHLVQKDTTTAMQASGQFPMGFARMAGSFALAGMVAWLLIGWAWPVTLLVWFSRLTIRREVSQWK